jgi:prevent-host-death family protein
LYDNGFRLQLPLGGFTVETSLEEEQAAQQHIDSAVQSATEAILGLHSDLRPEAVNAALRLNFGGVLVMQRKALDSAVESATDAIAEQSSDLRPEAVKKVLKEHLAETSWKVLVPLTEEKESGTAEAREAVAEGIVSVRTLSRNTTQVLKAVEELRQGVLVSRHGRIVAEIIPRSSADLLDAMRARDPDPVATLKAAERQIEAEEV